jgi:hypothetical protein
MGECQGQRPREAWDRQVGEPPKSYGAFCAYLEAGSERSLRKVIRASLTSGTETQQQRRFLTHPKPAAYLRTILRTWGRWSRQYHWQDRVAAYDEYCAYVRRHTELEAQAAVAARHAASRVRETALLRDEAIELREIGRTVGRRLLAVIRDPKELATLKLHRSKAVKVQRDLDGEGHTVAEDRTEITVPGVLDLLKDIDLALEIGARLYRMTEGEPTDRTAVEAEPTEAVKQEIAGMIFAEISAADAPTLEALKQRLLAIKNGDGKPL